MWWQNILSLPQLFATPGRLGYRRPRNEHDARRDSSFVVAADLSGRRIAR
jgi:hypothetical protein